jgi:hypothetical protein
LRERWLTIGLFLILCLGYVGSETVLRRGAYPTVGEGRASYDQVLAHLPGWLQAPLASAGFSRPRSCV